MMLSTQTLSSWYVRLRKHQSNWMKLCLFLVCNRLLGFPETLAFISSSLPNTTPSTTTSWRTTLDRKSRNSCDSSRKYMSGLHRISNNRLGNRKSGMRRTNQLFVTTEVDDDSHSSHRHGGAVTEEEKEEEEAAAENKKIKDPDFLRRNKHWIVLVDDEEAIRMAVGDYLYDQGYQVTACADVGALFEACQIGPPLVVVDDNDDDDDSITNKGATRGSAVKHSELYDTTVIKTKTLTLPDAVISDIRMPGKDGMHLLRLLRAADSRWERVPVILLTAKAMTQDRIAGYKAGADYFLPKPFHPEELLSMIDNAIRRRQEMAGTNGRLLDLKDELANVKEMLRQNGSKLVKKTNVYLTAAERQVLELLCQGCTNGEIATKRGVSVVGVNRMIQKLYSMTQTRTRTELVRWAITTGYVSAK